MWPNELVTTCPPYRKSAARVVELRSRGWTWDRIAAEVGYSNGSAASKAWRAAIRQHPDQSVDEIRLQERTGLEQMDSRLSDIITSPPLKTTAIGRVMTDPDTGEPVRDMGAVISAIRERRQIGESLRKLTGADAAPPRGACLDEDQVRLMAEVIVARRDRSLPAVLPPPPGRLRQSPARTAGASRPRAPPHPARCRPDPARRRPARHRGSRNRRQLTPGLDGDRYPGCG